MNPHRALLIGTAIGLLCSFAVQARPRLVVSPLQLQTAVCGTIGVSQRQFGPFDYRSIDGKSRFLVESAHFTADVESLHKGVTSRRPGGDIDYTLRAIPNHHRALLSMRRLAERTSLERPQDMRFSAQCWFERAIAFRPDDAVTVMLYADFLHAQKRTEEGLRMLAHVEQLTGDNPFTNYNLARMYLTLGQAAKALPFARKALELGNQRTDVKEQLASLGVWKEGEETPTGSGSGTSGPAPGSTADQPPQVPQDPARPG